MAGATDMSTPVTRGELQVELANFEIRLEQKLEQKLEQRLAHLATKAELEIWGGALLARIDAFEQRLLTELARHTRAIYESMSLQISIIDEKYADLPLRVSRLEAEVLAPKGR